MSEYGLPYMGSKSGIIASLALNFPKAKHFYDLFGGGGSATHYMMRNKSRSYETFHYNEIKQHIAETLKQAIAGDFNYSRFKPKWISRAEFHAKKASDGYICSCWSFGNDGDSYLFSEEIEPYKKSMHMAVVFEVFDDLAEKTLRFSKWPAIAKTIKQRRFYLRQLLEHYRKTVIPKHLYQFLSSKQLEQLQRLERLQQLQQLERLEITSLDYREVEIQNGALAYCDIPYKETHEYSASGFDHAAFFDWAASRKFPVFVSEYEIKDKRFKLVYTVDKRVMITQSGDSNKRAAERLYWNGVT